LLQQESKYLFFAFDINGGLDDQTVALELMILIALSLQRTLIIRQSETPPHHRTSKRSVPFDWDHHVDLAQTQIAKIMPDGTLQKTAATLRYIHEKDFDFKAYTRREVCYADGAQIYAPENAAYPLLCVKRVRLSKLKKSRTTINDPQLILSPRLFCYYKAMYHISLSASATVNELSDIVINHFGTDRQSSEYIRTVLNCEVRHRPHYFGMNYYIGMHLRVTEMPLLSLSYYYAAQKEHIRALIETVCQRHPKAPLYVMSDKVGYIDSLKGQYPIHSYQDFPKLRALFSSTDEPVNHNLLYSVEKNIIRHALVRICPPGRQWLAYDAGASYRIPQSIRAAYQATPMSRRIRYEIRTRSLHIGEKMIRLMKNPASWLKKHQ